MALFYDRAEAGKRLKQKRKELKLSTTRVAEIIEKAPSYYSDIERGMCGMSIETLIQLSECMELSMDYIIFGESESAGALSQPDTAFRILKKYDDQTQKKAVKLMKTYLKLSEPGDGKEE